MRRLTTRPARSGGGWGCAPAKRNTHAPWTPQNGRGCTASCWSFHACARGHVHRKQARSRAPSSQCMRLAIPYRTCTGSSQLHSPNVSTTVSNWCGRKRCSRVPDARQPDAHRSLHAPGSTSWPPQHPASPTARWGRASAAPALDTGEGWPAGMVPLPGACPGASDAAGPGGGSCGAGWEGGMSTRKMLSSDPDPASSGRRRCAWTASAAAAGLGDASAGPGGLGPCARGPLPGSACWSPPAPGLGCRPHQDHLQAEGGSGAVPVCADAHVHSHGVLS